MVANTPLVFLRTTVFGLIFGLKAGLSWWQCMLLAAATAGVKLTMAGAMLCVYEKSDIQLEPEVRIW